MPLRPREMPLRSVRLMWCHHCQQDVPASDSAAVGTLRCSRCWNSSPLPTTEAGEPNAPRHDALADLLEGTSRQRLSDIGRKLASHAVRPASDPLATLRSDPPHIDSGPQGNQPPAATRPRRRVGWVQVAAWLMTFLGTGLLAAGGAIIARSLLTSQANWWTWGLGCIFVGQSLVALGLLRVLMSLWTANRQAIRQMLTVEKQVAALKQTADALAGERHPTAASFYANLSREANPHMLLASLRGQIDELASRLNADL